MIPGTQGSWDAALTADDVETWIEHLDRVPVADHFNWLIDHDAIRLNGKATSLPDWVHFCGSLTPTELHNRLLQPTPITERIALASFVRWTDRIQSLLKDGSPESIPTAGVAEYFSDDLSACILVAYRRVGSTIALESYLCIPDPEAFFDPIAAVNQVRTDQELELLSRSLYNRHKILIHRNVLITIDRERESQVFGPTIDTLVLNEYLFQTRYEAHRTIQNSAYFEELLSRSISEETEREGTRFLEIGCGNGLMTATYAKNERSVRSICAIDISMEAVSATFRNSATQRRFPGGVGDHE